MEGGIDEKFETKTYGFEEILRDVKVDILTFFEEYTAWSPYLLTIKGEIGSGKTIFVLNLIEELSKSTLFQYYQTWSGGKPLPILCGHINPESDLEFLNMWRPVLRQMLTFFVEQKEMSKSKVLNILLHSVTDQNGSGTENLKDLMCEILGLSDNEKCDTETVEMPIVQQVEPKQTNFAFIQRPQYEQEDVDKII